MHLKRLKGRLARAMKGKADPYTEAHLDDLHMAVDRALNRIETCGWVRSTRDGDGSLLRRILNPRHLVFLGRGPSGPPFSFAPSMAT